MCTRAIREWKRKAERTEQAGKPAYTAFNTMCVCVCSPLFKMQQMQAQQQDKAVAEKGSSSSSLIDHTCSCQLSFNIQSKCKFPRTILSFLSLFLFSLLFFFFSHSIVLLMTTPFCTAFSFPLPLTTEIVRKMAAAAVVHWAHKHTLISIVLSFSFSRKPTTIESEHFWWKKEIKVNRIVCGYVC